MQFGAEVSIGIGQERRRLDRFAHGREIRGLAPPASRKSRDTLTRGLGHDIDHGFPSRVGIRRPARLAAVVAELCERFAKEHQAEGA